MHIFLVIYTEKLNGSLSPTETKELNTEPGYVSEYVYIHISILVLSHILALILFQVWLITAYWYDWTLTESVSFIQLKTFPATST